MRKPNQIEEQNLQRRQSSSNPKQIKWLFFNSVKDIFQYYRTRINNFFTQKAIFTSVRIEKTPIHFYIPYICVQRTNDGGYYPQVEVYVSPICGGLHSE